MSKTIRHEKYDELSGIIAWESGELDDEGTRELFQHLVDNGHAWTLQGTYGRTASALLKAGEIEATTETARRVKNR
jgi:hypothetical protein